MTFSINQQKILNAAATKQHIGLFTGCGTGKTRMALSLARGRVLVLCPKTQKVNKTWERELIKIPNPAVTNLTVVSKERFDPRTSDHVDTFIIDEADDMAGGVVDSRGRLSSSGIAKKVIAYLNGKVCRVIVCTATPTRSPVTLYNLSRFLGKNYDWKKWRDAFFVSISKKVTLKKSKKEMTLGLFIRRRDGVAKDRMATVVNALGFVGRLQDWEDVPEQTHIEKDVGLTRAQQEVYRDLRILYPINAASKIHQWEQGVYEGTQIATNKIEAITKLLEEFGKVLVFAWYTEQIKMYEDHFKKEGHNVFVVRGGDKDRDTTLVAAEKAATGVVIINSQICAGYNLPSIRCTIFASQTYSFRDYDQSFGRTLRYDNYNVRNLYVTLIAGGIDRAIKDCLDNKQDFSEAIYEKTGS